MSANRWRPLSWTPDKLLPKRTRRAGPRRAGPRRAGPRLGALCSGLRVFGSWLDPRRHNSLTHVPAFRGETKPIKQCRGAAPPLHPDPRPQISQLKALVPCPPPPRGTSPPGW